MSSLQRSANVSGNLNSGLERGSPPRRRLFEVAWRPRRTGLNEDGVQQGFPDSRTHQPVLLTQVDFLVLEKMLLLGEAFIALIATVGPLSGMDALVPDQVRRVAKVLAAIEAGQGAAAPPRMQPLVRDKALLLGETLRTPAAAVWPFAPVALGVLPIGRLDVEGLHALGAAIRLVCSWPPRKGLQIMALLEGLLAGH